MKIDSYGFSSGFGDGTGCDYGDIHSWCGGGGFGDGGGYGFGDGNGSGYGTGFF